MQLCKNCLGCPIEGFTVPHLPYHHFSMMVHKLNVYEEQIEVIPGAHIQPEQTHNFCPPACLAEILISHAPVCLL
eukprot:8739789-Pyramimonas_sp.AAC.1